jgi:hypothetical protein
MALRAESTYQKSPFPVIEAGDFGNPQQLT